MRVVGLEVENVKRLKTVSIRPDRNSVIVGGRNEQGKTSLLDSIQMAIGGKGSVPDVPIRRGAKRAEIVCDLGDLLVKRAFTQKGTELVVTGKDGMKLSSPQTILDKFFTALTFDPLAFQKERPDRQLDLVKRLVGLDFSAADAARKELFDRRTDVGREAKRLKGLAESLGPRVDDDDMPAPDDLESLVKRLSEAKDRNAAVDRAAEQREQEKREVHRLKSEVLRIRGELERAETRLKAAAAKLDAQDASEGPAKEDTAAIEAEIARARNDEAELRNAKARNRAHDEWREAEEKYAALTAELESHDLAKQEMIDRAKFPVEGLSFGDGSLLYKGLPFDQASQAERLRVSVAMGLALNPDLKVLLIRDGSCLDSEHLDAIREMAVAADAQIWIERVGKGSECSVVIEDGEVEEPEGAQ